MESQQPLNPNLPAVPGGETTVELVHQFDQLLAIRAFLFDLDGVLAENSVQITESGEQLRLMNIRDGHAIHWALQAGFPIAVITSSRSEGIRRRLQELGIGEYYPGAADKNDVFVQYLRRTGLDARQVCFMGDDLPDIPVLKRVIFGCCPADAVYEVKELCDYISPYQGGKGCVRDIIERVLKAQGKWPVF